MYPCTYRLSIRWDTVDKVHFVKVAVVKFRSAFWLAVLIVIQCLVTIFYDKRQNAAQFTVKSFPPPYKFCHSVAKECAQTTSRDTWWRKLSAARACDSVWARVTEKWCYELRRNALNKSLRQKLRKGRTNRKMSPQRRGQWHLFTFQLMMRAQFYGRYATWDAIFSASKQNLITI